MKGKTILIVDDDSLVSDLLNELFTEAGYITLIAQDDTAALAILKGRECKIDWLSVIFRA